MTTALRTVAVATQARIKTTQSQIGPSLARELISEVLSKPYSDPDEGLGAIGLDGGEVSSNRLAFDDVDDFDSWSSSSAINADGSNNPIGLGWSRMVDVDFVEPSTLDISSIDLGLKRITVTVTSPNGAVSMLETLRSRRGANQRLPYADRGFVTSASVSVEVSGSTVDLSRSQIKNHAQDQ